MIRRKAVIGLSLLCALALCAVGAGSASAATTAGVCSTTAATKDFSDAHCNTRAAPPSTFGHKLFANGVKQTVAVSNTATSPAKSSFTLEGKLGGVATSVTCNKVTGSSSVTNNAGGTLTLGEAKTEFSECVVTSPVEKCKVAEPIITETKQTDPMNLKISSGTKALPTGGTSTFHEENASGTEMGLKFVPKEGTKFVTITYTDFGGGKVCPEALKGAKPIEGFFYATGSLSSGTGESASGGTLKVTKSSSISGLTFGGNPMTLEGELTLSVGGEALIVTTTV